MNFNFLEILSLRSVIDISWVVVVITADKCLAQNGATRMSHDAWVVRGCRPPPLVSFRRPLPPPPHLEPRAIDFSTTPAVGALPHVPMSAYQLSVPIKYECLSTVSACQLCVPINYEYLSAMSAEQLQVPVKEECLSTMHAYHLGVPINCECLSSRSAYHPGSPIGHISYWNKWLIPSSISG